MALPSAVPERPSALKLLVLFFRRCFLRLACGDGGGSILGLVVLEMLGLEQTESPRPVSMERGWWGAVTSSVGEPMMLNYYRCGF